MKYKALLFSLFATANLFAQHPAIHFEIETDQPCQTMDYFGASDCRKCGTRRSQPDSLSLDACRMFPSGRW